jgi:lipase chaperone LimK
MDAVTAFPTQRLVLLDDALEAYVDAYGDTYAKHSRIRGGRAFERDEPDSLVARRAVAQRHGARCQAPRTPSHCWADAATFTSQPAGQD